MGSRWFLTVCVLSLACFFVVGSITPEAEEINMIGINQSPITAGWTTANTGMTFGIGGVGNVESDTTVLYGVSATLRIDPIGEYTNPNREANSYSLPISPGDRIVFRIRMKTSAAAGGETDRGARFGVDMYGVLGRIVGCQTPLGETWTPPNNWPATEDDQFVDWGNDWTLRVMDFTVAETYPADPYANPAYTEGQYYVPTSIIPWLQVASSVDGGQAWFADVKLYINPTVAGLSHLTMMRKR